MTAKNKTSKKVLSEPSCKTDVHVAQLKYTNKFV